MGSITLKVFQGTSRPSSILWHKPFLVGERLYSQNDYTPPKKKEFHVLITKRNNMQLTLYQDAIPNSYYRWNVHPHSRPSKHIPSRICYNDPPNLRWTLVLQIEALRSWKFVRLPWHRRRSLEFGHRCKIRLVWKEQGDEWCSFSYSYMWMSMAFRMADDQ